MSLSVTCVAVQQGGHTHTHTHIHTHSSLSEVPNTVILVTPGVDDCWKCLFGCVSWFPTLVSSAPPFLFSICLHLSSSPWYPPSFYLSPPNPILPYVFQWYLLVFLHLLSSRFKHCFTIKENELLYVFAVYTQCVRNFQQCNWLYWTNSVCVKPLSPGYLLTFD